MTNSILRSIDALELASLTVIATGLFTSQYLLVFGYGVIPAATVFLVATVLSIVLYGIWRNSIFDFGMAAVAVALGLMSFFYPALIASDRILLSAAMYENALEERSVIHESAPDRLARYEALEDTMLACKPMHDQVMRAKQLHGDGDADAKSMPLGVRMALLLKSGPTKPCLDKMQAVK